MKLYISEGDQDIDIKDKFNTVDDYDESDTVLILPGGLGCINDLVSSIIDKKKTYVYNKKSYFDPLIINLYNSHLRKDLEKMPKDMLNMEDNLEIIIDKLEVENGKINNGKSSKLL